jgi:hypothetical protein
MLSIDGTLAEPPPVLPASFPPQADRDAAIAKAIVPAAARFQIFFFIFLFPPSLFLS